MSHLWIRTKHFLMTAHFFKVVYKDGGWSVIASNEFNAITLYIFNDITDAQHALDEIHECILRKQIFYDVRGKDNANE